MFQPERPWRHRVDLFQRPYRSPIVQPWFLQHDMASAIKFWHSNLVRQNEQKNELHPAYVLHLDSFPRFLWTSDQNQIYMLFDEKCYEFTLHTDWDQSRFRYLIQASLLPIEDLHLFQSTLFFLRSDLLLLSWDDQNRTARAHKTITFHLKSLKTIGKWSLRHLNDLTSLVLTCDKKTLIYDTRSEECVKKFEGKFMDTSDTSSPQSILTYVHQVGFRLYDCAKANPISTFALAQKKVNAKWLDRTHFVWSYASDAKKGRNLQTQNIYSKSYSTTPPFSYYSGNDDLEVFDETVYVSCLSSRGFTDFQWSPQLANLKPTIRASASSASSNKINRILLVKSRSRFLIHQSSDNREIDLGNFIKGYDIKKKLKDASNVFSLK
jgi:hypothetical protein